MPDKTTSLIPNEKRDIPTLIGDTVMVILTLLFIFLYTAASSGKLDPLKDNTMLLRFEPVIFLFIGYYFGRLPARRTEKSFKDEITRQAHRADASQYAKEKAQQERETLEEKIKNAKTALKMTAQIETVHDQGKSIRAAISILNS